MQLHFHDLTLLATIAICACSLVYLLFAALCVERFHRSRKSHSCSTDHLEPVTILKPVCGLDPEMDENLRSFCVQDYPGYQVIFGVRDEHDPAIPIIRKIIKDYPGLDINLVIDHRIHGTNHKVSNLINMSSAASHAILLIADSDMRVPEDYLRAVVAPFADQDIGAVTCLYAGTPKGGLASALNAMFINEWFLPSVLISRLIQETRFCLGATMAVRREILEDCGGFEALSDHLADDYMLGKLVTDSGYKIHLSRFVVENIIQEPDLGTMLDHELRWARTLRTVKPIAYPFTFITDTFVMSGLAGLTVYLHTDQLLLPAALIGFVLLARIAFHLRVNHILDTGNSGPLWLVPLRDILTFLIRLASFTGNTIVWRRNTFSVDDAGLIYNEDATRYQLAANKKIPDLAINEDY